MSLSKMTFSITWKLLCKNVALAEPHRILSGHRTNKMTSSIRMQHQNMINSPPCLLSRPTKKRPILIAEVERQFSYESNDRSPFITGNPINFCALNFDVNNFHGDTRSFFSLKPIFDLLIHLFVVFIRIVCVSVFFPFSSSSSTLFAFPHSIFHRWFSSLFIFFCRFFFLFILIPFLEFVW